jgi:hypothetical protein
MITGE